MAKATTTDWSFTRETVQFLTDLKANNERQWFAAHKPIYDEIVKPQAETFCDLMAAELEAMTKVPHRSKLFRIYRDVRFSKDKTPYNAHVHISFFPEGRRGFWFFGLDPERLVVGAGAMDFDKASLTDYRAAVAGDNGKKIAATVAKLLKAGYRMHDPELKKVPREYDADHPRGDLLRRKGLAMWKDIGTAKAATRKDMIGYSRDSFKALKPVNDWLAEQLS